MAKTSFPYTQNQSFVCAVSHFKIQIIFTWGILGFWTTNGRRNLAAFRCLPHSSGSASASAVLGNFPFSFMLEGDDWGQRFSRKSFSFFFFYFSHSPSHDVVQHVLNSLPEQMPAVIGAKVAHSALLGRWRGCFSDTVLKCARETLVQTSEREGFFADGAGQ